ncbi:MAG: thermonuclease family protein [Candidatus Omnitrophica bacterium]|nr:thermonuclease family protein [Candidatus Omnitrophota bacterium]
MNVTFYLILFLVLCGSAQAREDYSAEAKVTLPLGRGEQSHEMQPYVVERVADGDTFRLPNGQNLKLAEVNAPEVHHAPKLTQEAKRFRKEVWTYRTWGVEAQTLVGKLLNQSQNEIKAESNGETFDEEGNLLTNVYIPLNRLETGMIPDGTVILEKGNEQYEIFLNAYLVKLGLAEVVDQNGGTHQELLRMLEAEAKKNKRGLWA